MRFNIKNCFVYHLYLYNLGWNYNTELHDLALFSTVPQSDYIPDELIGTVLSFISRSPLMRSIRSFEFDHNAALLVPVNHEKLFFAQSSCLTHVSITLRELPDCVRLLNQLGSQIHSFTVSIIHAYVGNEDVISKIESVSYVPI